LTDPVDYAAVERELGENPSLREAALAYLRADYVGNHAYAKTFLCVVLEHPDKYPPDVKPPRFKPGGCPCGKRKPEQA
jgi:hypothetical protein